MPNFNEQAWLEGFVNEAAAMGLDKEAAHELLKTAVRRDMMESDPAFAAGFQGELEKQSMSSAEVEQILFKGAPAAAKMVSKAPQAAPEAAAAVIPKLRMKPAPAAVTAHPETAAANAGNRQTQVATALQDLKAQLQPQRAAAPAKPGFLGKHPGVALAGGAALAGPATLGLQEMLRRFNVGWGHNPEEQDAMNMMFEASRGRGDIRGSTAAAAHYLREAARRQNAMFGGYSMFPGEGRYPYGGGFYPGV